MTAREQFQTGGEPIPGSIELTSPDASVSVQKVVQSLGSKVMAAGLPTLAALLAFLGELPPYPRAGVCAAGILAGAWLWNESKKRQHALQVELVKAGSSKFANSVEIEPAPAKSG